MSTFSAVEGDTNRHKLHETAVLTSLSGPVLFQYVGRWGLYARVLVLYPDQVGQDAFEGRKLAIEPLAFAASLALVCGWGHPWATPGKTAR